MTRLGAFLWIVLAAVAHAQNGQTEQLSASFSFNGTLPNTGGGDPYSSGPLVFSGTGNFAPLGPAGVYVTVDHGQTLNAVNIRFYNIGTGGVSEMHSLPQLPAQSLNASFSQTTHKDGSSTGTISGTGDITSGNSVFAGASGSVSFSLALTATTSTAPFQWTFSGTANVTISVLKTTPPAEVLAAGNSGSPIVFSMDLVGSNQSTQYFTSSQTDSGGPWLNVTPANGTIPPLNSATLNGTANPSGMPPGVYQGGININTTSGQNARLRYAESAAQPAGGSSFTVPVTLIIASAGQLILSQRGLSFQAAAGVTSAPAQTLSVSASGTAPLSFETSVTTLSGGNWLSLAPASGTVGATSPVAVSIDINVSGLAPGDYFGRIDFSAAGASNSPQELNVALRVVPASTATPPVFSPAALVFVTTAGANPAPQTIQISNTSTQSPALMALADPANPWFTVKAAQPLAESVSVNTAGLGSGAHQGTLGLWNASGISYQVPVLLVVKPSGSCAPTQLLPAFTNLSGGFAAVAGFPVALEAAVIDDCGNPLTSGSVTASFGGADAPVVLASAGGAGKWSGTWLPHNVAGGPASIALSAHSVSPALDGSAVVSGTLAANLAIPMMGSPSPAVSAASFAANQPVSPGGFVSIFGTNLTAEAAAEAALPFPTSLAGARVLMGGEPLPLQYAGNGQINALIPWDVPVNAILELTVESNGMASMPATVVTAAEAPAVFTQNETGSGPGSIIVVKPDGAQFMADASHPASAGDVLEIYCAGLGTVNPALPLGSAAPFTSLSRTVTPVQVTIGGLPAKVDFAGLAPGFAGLYQVNAQVPEGITVGPDVPLILYSGNYASPPVTLAIE